MSSTRLCIRTAAAVTAVLAVLSAGQAGAGAVHACLAIRTGLRLGSGRPRRLYDGGAVDCARSSDWRGAPIPRPLSCGMTKCRPISCTGGAGARRPCRIRGRGVLMFETYRMLGREREAELLRR